MKAIKTNSFICAGVILCLFFGCTQTSIHQFNGTALGTYYSITYVGKQGKLLQNEIDSILHEISSQFSIFDSLSMVSRINKGERVTLNSDFILLLEKSEKISELSNGAFDITVAPLVNLWGFGKSEKGEVKESSIDSLKNIIGYRKIHLQDNYLIKDDPRVELNFNAVAKGFAVDKVSEHLLKKGYTNHLVEIGGEVVASGEKPGSPWIVGIQIPTKEKNGMIATDYIFALKNKAVATSGNYRNYQEENGIRYSHIINPVTGRSEKSDILSVTVIANDCTTADALATAFMVLGKQQSLLLLSSYPEYAAYFIFDENGIIKAEKNAGFPANE